MAAYRLVPGIIDKIDRTMAGLGVRPADAAVTPAAAAKRRDRVYMAPVVTSRGATVWFKSTLQDWAWVRTTVREEIIIQRLFAAYERRHRPSFESPTYLASHDDRRGHVWLLRKYWQALYAGDMVDEFGFSDQFFRRVSPATMARALGDIRHMTLFLRRRFHPSVHHLDWYATDWRYYRRTFWRPLLEHRLNPGWTRPHVNALEAWLIDQRRFLSRQATAFTHGDLYPNNIMIQSMARRPVVIIDWELSHLNLPTFDPSMVYLHAWRRPAWQKELRRLTLAALGNDAAAERSWRLSSLSLATRLAGFAWHRLTDFLPERYPSLRRQQVSTVRAMYERMMGELRRLGQTIS